MITFLVSAPRRENVFVLQLEMAEFNLEFIAFLGQYD